MFQYSLTNLVWCNNEKRRCLNVGYIVSVFSDESRVVQPKRTTGRRLADRVSVFSDESRVVQPAVPAMTVPSPNSFSIL